MSAKTSALIFFNRIIIMVGASLVSMRSGDVSFSD